MFLLKKNQQVLAQDALRHLTDADKGALALIDSDTMSYLGPMIQVSGVCNLKCAMCGGARDLVPGKFMDKSLFELICDRLKADGINSMIIAGAYGEPFLHPQIFDFLEHAKSLGFNIVLSSHGNNLDEERIHRVAKLGLAHMQISFCGYDARTYERIYKGGKFEKVVPVIRMLRQAIRDSGHKTEFMVNGVCDEDDPQLARLTHELLVSLGVAPNEIRIILPHNFGGVTQFEEMHHEGGMPSFKPVKGEHLSICKVLTKVPGILWDGRISACGCLDHKGQLEIGNIKFMSISQARKSEPFLRIVDAFRAGDVNDIALCDSCDVPYGENEVREYVFQENR